MELKDFITQTLDQVIGGIKAAQEGEDGKLINARILGGVDAGGMLVNAGGLGMLTRVDFDVLVSAETSGSGGAKLTVFGIGAEGAGEHKSASANRITFSVPIRLPDGDTSVREAVMTKRSKPIVI